MNAKRRDATLLAALWQLELDAADDALLLLDQVVDQLLSQAAREHKDERFKALPELDRAARRLRAAVLVLLDPPPGGLDALWAAIGARVSRNELHAASEAIGRPHTTRARHRRRGRRVPRGAAAPLPQPPPIPARPA